MIHFKTVNMEGNFVDWNFSSIEDLLTKWWSEEDSIYLPCNDDKLYDVSGVDSWNYRFDSTVDDLIDYATFEYWRNKEKERQFIFGISEEQRKIFIEKYGTDLKEQADIVQEECGELIQALGKIKRDKPGAKENVIEEMSHVVLSMMMVAHIMGITQDDIDKKLEEKINDPKNEFYYS